jgi:putative ABC transport system permease protein
MNLRDFRVGWRVLAKAPAYSAVVVLGLAVGIAACFLLLGFVRHSFSYDRQVPQRERVMRLMERWHLASLGDEWSSNSSFPARDAALHSGQPLLGTMVIDSDVDVRAVGRAVGRMGARAQSIHLTLVDPDFQAIFAPPVLAGDLHTALLRPDTIALTRDTAVKLFGRADVLGQSIKSDDQLFTVAAVLADPPAATTLPYEALAGAAGISAEARANFAQSWGRTPGRVYLKLLPRADPDAVLAAVRRGLRQSPLSMRDKIEYRLSPLADAYLDPDLKGSSRLHGDRRLTLGLAAVGLLILLLAATNYVNLATVRILARQREIAMRKVLGASSRAVAQQFLAESVLVCLIATGLGLLLAWLVLPLFADLVQRRFDRMFDAPALAGALLLALLLGLAAGAWPAWSALRVRPGAALAGRGGSETVRGLWARRVLTTLQFGVAMGLTGTTLAVAWQTHYASLLSPGFDAAPLLTFETPHAMSEPATRAFRDALVRLPGVAAVGESSMPITFTNNIISLQREGGDIADFNLYGVSPEFFQAFGLQPLAGRLYDPARDRMSDRDRVVINASAARKLGFASAQDAVGREVIDKMGVGGKTRALQVVGVAPDMRHRSARSSQQPSVFYLADWVHVFVVRCSQDPVALQRRIEDLWPRHFPDATLDIRRMPAFLVDVFYADDLRLAKLLGVASVIATAIAAFGIYVLAAYSVQRREKEIVLRKLYGAGRAAIGVLVAREFALLVGAGALLGLPLAWVAIARYLGAFSERAPVGAWTLLAALLVAGMVALASTLRHALAALRIRPALALRE